MQRIRLVVVDVDDVISRDEAAPLDFKEIAHYTSPYEDGLGLVDILAKLLSPETEHGSEKIS